MKIGILTQPLRYNYGGILQNFALQTVLIRMEHEVVTLDPPRYIRKSWWQYPILILRRVIARYIRGYRDVHLFAEHFQNSEREILGTNTFKFIDQYIQRQECDKLSKEIGSNDFDAYVVGSDQIWRCRYNDGRIQDMFLLFTKGWNVKRIAYAASFGTTEWEGNLETTKICREAIKNFDLVSVRESSGIDICKHIFNIDAQHVLDPTLFLTKDDYMKIVEKAGPLDSKQGDLYTYILDEDERNRDLVCSISNKMGLEPYTYCSRACDCHGIYSTEESIQPPIELWLKGFNQAKIVFTDSFHACVFSIIFRKPFYLYANKDRGVERYISLFNMLGIKDRTVHTMEDVINMPPIDYDAVYYRLSSLQEKSLNLLNNSLTNNK